MTWTRLSSRPRVVADVQPSVGGGGGDEGDADVDGVALVAVFGGGVAETHVLARVVGGEGEGAVSASMGHGERTVAVGGDDVPQVAVADRLPARWCASSRSLRRVATMSPG